MISKLPELLAQKARAEGRDAISGREIIAATGLTWRKVYPLLDPARRDWSVTADDMARLCTYLHCTPGELFVVEDVT